MFPAELTAVFANLLTNAVKAVWRGWRTYSRFGIQWRRSGSDHASRTPVPPSDLMRQSAGLSHSSRRRRK